MTQTTTQLGRAQLQHPDLGFDTDDNGVALHNALASMWTSVSNHLPTRWTGSITLLNSASTTVTHYFNLALSKLKIIIFEGGVQLTDDQIASYYSITQSTINSIAIQNISGGSKTFDALVFAYKTVITSSDLDPSVNGSWDTVNGTNWNKSLYVNGPYTVATAQEFENVIVLGNLTLNANLTVRGRLVVVGNVTGNGFKFDCDGDVSVIGDISITGISAPSITIGGNFTNVIATTSPIFRSNSASLGTLTIKGNATVVNASYLSQFINAEGSNSAGCNINIYGDCYCGLTTSGNGNIAGVGNTGGAIKVLGNVTLNNSMNINSIGSAATGTGGSSGAITINGSVIIGGGSLSSAGGNATTSGNAGNGANIIIGGEFVGTNISTIGGNSTAGGSGGNSGSLTINGDVTFEGNVTTNGGSAATNSAFVAGTAGDLTIKGSTVSRGSTGITCSGGNGGNTAKQGGTVLIRNISIKGELKSNGGTNNGGLGGTITINGYAYSSNTDGGRCSISSNGGSISDAAKSAGNGGTIKIAGDVSKSYINSTGGNAGPGINCGNGGAITVYGSCTNFCSITANGGAAGGAAISGTFGAGGTVGVSQNCDGDITASGGQNTSMANVTKTAGAGGSVSVSGTVSGVFTAIGGDNVDPEGGNGGAGGSITLGGGKATIYCRGGDVINGSGTGTSGNGGACNGSVTINGDIEIYECIIRGGDSAYGSGGNVGSPHTFNGDVRLIGVAGWTGLSWLNQLEIRGGDSTKATAGTVSGGSINDIIYFKGDIKGTLSSIVFRGGDATSAFLTVGNGGNCRTNISASNTIIINGNVTLGYHGQTGSGGTNLDIITMRGGHSRSAVGGRAPALTCFGSFNVFGQILISGGDVNGSAVVGSLGILCLFGGGYIGKVYTTRPFSGGTAEGSGTAIFYFNGNMTIGTWSVTGVVWPRTRYLVKCGSPWISDAGQITYSSCFMYIGNGSGTPYDAGGNDNNLWPTAAGSTPAPMMGLDNAGTTVWKYRTFANA